ncbi:MAG: hypothetical protein ACT4PJ_08635 [Gemmatimonadaceae bacterium]
MRRIWFLSLPALLLGAAAVHAQSADSVPPLKPDGRLLRPRTDSLAIYVVEGMDTTRTGLVDRLEFTRGAVNGWLGLANGDSVSIEAPLPATVYNSSSFDLVIRASPLGDRWRANVPAILANTRTVVPLNARVAGSDIIDGDDTWRVEAELARVNPST